MKHLLLLTLAAVNVLLSSAPDKPPMKMGLWDATSLAPTSAQAGQPAKRTVRSCITPENWIKLMGPTAKEACPKVNEVWTDTSYSFDVQCVGKPKMASVNIHFDSPETQHTSLDMLSTPDGQPINMHRDMEQHWVGSDCGDVSPDHPVIVVGAGDGHSH